MRCFQAVDPGFGAWRRLLGTAAVAEIAIGHSNQLPVSLVEEPSRLSASIPASRRQATAGSFGVDRHAWARSSGSVS